MEHSLVIGGSSAKRRIQCTGSANLEAQLKEQLGEDDSTSWAREGDALHALMYRALDTGELPGALAYKHADGSGVLLDADTMTKKFWPAWEAVQKVMKDHRIVEYDLETRVVLKKTCGKEIFGTLDFVGKSANGYVVIVDFKFGHGVKEYAKENFQLAFYTVGLHDEGDAMLEGVTDYVFVIVQPWRDDTEPTISEWRTDMFWLEGFRQLLMRAYQRITKGDVNFKAGSWCQFCRARAICPEQNQSLVEFSGKHVEEGGAVMTAVELANLLEMGARAAKQYEALVKMATALAADGMKIPGFKVIESLGHRTWISEAAAALTAARLVGSEAMTAPRLLTPAQLKNVFKAKKHDFSVMEEHIERPSRGPRLVPDSNPAPELQAASNLDLPFNVVKLNLPSKP